MTENMEKKILLAQLNDINGNFILFKLVPSTTEFVDILIELIERMKRVLNITTPLILVVDREAEALSLFQELNRRRICFIVVITKNSKTTEEMASIPESEFKERFRKKELARKEKIMKELENIDLEAKFFQLNTASTTFNIAVKEAVANANSELTRQISHDGQPMKVNRAKKVLYKLPGKITVDSSTKIVELAPIRNRPLRKRIECLCNWLT